MPETILLTGISGFIAKHVALTALNRGHFVRGSLRSSSREAEVRDALRPHLDDPAAMERLSFVTADLDQDGGWDRAMTGVTAVIHTASPFPMAPPKDEMALIGPAREGTLRVLRAAHAAGIGRVVLTSSVAAVMYSRNDGIRNESDWSDVSDPVMLAYAKSKTLAEQAAWEFVRSNGMALTTINPVLVVGAPLDRHFGTSLDVIVRVLKGRDPMLPDLHFSLVDVADVARMHVAALEDPQTAGKRFIAAADGPGLSMVDMGRLLKQRYPTRRIATMQAPRMLLRLMGLVDPAVKSLLPELGRRRVVTNQRAQAEMGMRFVSAEDSLAATADWMVKQGLIWK